MRRAGALLGLVALAAVLVSIGGRSLGQAHAATGACTVHTKRVVRHVKRHGKWVRIVRPRHYRTCEAAPVVSAPALAPATSAPAEPATPSTPTPLPPVLEMPKIEPPAQPAPETPQPEPEANALGVAAQDSGGFRFLLSRQTVKTGRLVVQLTNEGEDPHTMDMQRVGPGGQLEGPVIAELAAEPGGPGERTTVEVQPGTYRMWCTIGHHAEHGMTAEVTVE